MNFGEIHSSEFIVFILAGMAFFLLLSGSIIYFILLYQQRRQQFIQQQKYLHDNYEQVLLQARMEIREQTLQHVSLELHDNLGQIASLIKINLNTLPKDLPAQVEEKIQECRELLKQLIADIKGLSLGLNQQYLYRTGLIQALETEASRLKMAGISEVNFKTKGVEPIIEPEKQIFIFRMSQEILNNIIKHSGASAVSINLSYEIDKITLNFADNGRGFNLAENSSNVNRLAHSGLINLKTRSDLIGADLKIESNLHSGTNISISLTI